MSVFSKMLFCLKHSNGQKTSVAARIMRIGIISVITCLVVVFAYVSTSTTKLLNSNYEQQIRSSARIYADMISQWTGLIRQQLENEATKAEFVDTKLSLDERKKLLEADAENTEFTDLSISDASGKTYNDTDISEREYFKEAMNGQTYISSPIVRKTDNSITIMVGSKVKTKNFDGVIYGGLSIDFFNNLLATVDIGETGVGFLVDKEGTIIADKDEQIVRDQINPIELAKTDSKYAGLASVVTEMKDGNEGTMKFKYTDGKEYLVGYFPIDGVEGWSIGVMLETSETTSAVSNLIYVCLIICLGLLVIEVLVALFVSTGIAYPIKQSSEFLEKIANGDLSENGDLKIRTDETGVLLKTLEKTRSSLKGYVGEIDVVLEGVSKGNLNQKVTAEYVGEFNNIKNSLNLILDSLNKTFGNTANASANLLEGARQVEMASQSLASASTEQASAIVQITTSIEGITKNVDENTEEVVRTNKLAQETKEEADNGNAQMQRMIEAMNDINASSQNIAKIMKVIDDISFQTNILALNASVEAARAGVHGKGFAVVAEEVRNLAGKSSEAASEIAEMIDDSIKKIHNGTEIASNTAERLAKIVDDIDDIAKAMIVVADKSREQAVSIGQVNTGIEQISSAVQNNSATSEECAAASVELSGQAEELMKQVKFFKLR